MFYLPHVMNDTQEILVIACLWIKSEKEKENNSLAEPIIKSQQNHQTTLFYVKKEASNVNLTIVSQTIPGTHQIEDLNKTDLSYPEMRFILDTQSVRFIIFPKPLQSALNNKSTPARILGLGYFNQNLTSFKANSLDLNKYLHDDWTLSSIEFFNLTTILVGVIESSQNQFKSNKTSLIQADINWSEENMDLSFLEATSFELHPGIATWSLLPNQNTLVSTAYFNSANQLRVCRIEHLPLTDNGLSCTYTPFSKNQIIMYPWSLEKVGENYFISWKSFEAVGLVKDLIVAITKVDVLRNDSFTSNVLEFGYSRVNFVSNGRGLIGVPNRQGTDSVTLSLMQNETLKLHLLSEVSLLIESSKINQMNETYTLKILDAYNEDLSQKANYLSLQFHLEVIQDLQRIDSRLLNSTAGNFMTHDTLLPAGPDLVQGNSIDLKMTCPCSKDWTSTLKTPTRITLSKNGSMTITDFGLLKDSLIYYHYHEDLKKGLRIDLCLKTISNDDAYSCSNLIDESLEGEGVLAVDAWRNFKVYVASVNESVSRFKIWQNNAGFAEGELNGGGFSKCEVVFNPGLFLVLCLDSSTSVLNVFELDVLAVKVKETVKVGPGSYGFSNLINFIYFEVNRQKMEIHLLSAEKNTRIYTMSYKALIQNIGAEAEHLQYQQAYFINQNLSKFARFCEMERSFVLIDTPDNQLEAWSASKMLKNPSLISRLPLSLSSNSNQDADNLRRVVNLCCHPGAGIFQLAYQTSKSNKIISFRDEEGISALQKILKIDELNATETMLFDSRPTSLNNLLQVALPDGDFSRSQSTILSRLGPFLQLSKEDNTKGFKKVEIQAQIYNLKEQGINYEVRLLPDPNELEVTKLMDTDGLQEGVTPLSSILNITGPVVSIDLNGDVNLLQLVDRLDPYDLGHRTKFLAEVFYEVLEEFVVIVEDNKVEYYLSVYKDMKLSYKRWSLGLVKGSIIKKVALAFISPGSQRLGVVIGANTPQGSLQAHFYIFDSSSSQFERNSTRIVDLKPGAQRLSLWRARDEGEVWLTTLDQNLPIMSILDPLTDKNRLQSMEENAYHLDTSFLSDSTGITSIQGYFVLGDSNKLNIVLLKQNDIKITHIQLNYKNKVLLDSHSIELKYKGQSMVTDSIACSQTPQPNKTIQCYAAGVSSFIFSFQIPEDPTKTLQNPQLEPHFYTVDSKRASKIQFKGDFLAIRYSKDDLITEFLRVYKRSNGPFLWKEEIVDQSSNFGFSSLINGSQYLVSPGVLKKGFVYKLQEFEFYAKNLNFDFSEVLLDFGKLDGSIQPLTVNLNESSSNTIPVGIWYVLGVLCFILILFMNVMVLSFMKAERFDVDYKKARRNSKSDEIQID